MDSAYYHRQLAALEKESADIQRKIADESKREFDKLKEIDSISRSITSTASASTIQSKNSQIRAKQSDIVNIRSKIADYQKKFSDKTVAINTAKQAASKEELNERKKQQELEKKQREQQIKAQQQESDKLKREQLSHQRSLQASLDEQRRLLDQLVEANYAPSPNLIQEPVMMKKYDLFISHASEDKEEFVRPLAEKLIDAGVEVWYDEYTLKFGDSLRRTIDAGLRDSRFGLVILSPHFFKKNWPQHELDGLVAREMAGSKVILPIWHRITKDEVLAQSPTLADKLALSSATHSFDDIVAEIKSLLE